MESKKRTLQTMSPLKIGNVEMQNPLVLAPMAGVTDLPFPRSLQGAGSRPDLYGDGQREGDSV